ncbi:MAG: Type 1 glutamine amidotransferase-like domain-containing protein [Patescibacteria group bacterium]
MKLFLVSQGLQPAYEEAYFSLLPKRNSPPKIAWIADAAEPYIAKGSTPWLDSSEKQLRGYGLELIPVRLLDFIGKTGELKKLLEKLDGVWIAGGNTHYLRWAMAKSGFDKIIKKLLTNGLVYAGESAGAMVVAPNIELSEDNPEDLADVPEIIEEGLGLYNKLILPHWGVPEYKDNLLNIDRHHRARGRATTFLTNSGAIIIND